MDASLEALVEKLNDPKGRIRLIAECHRRLQQLPDDDEIKAIRAQQSGIRTAGEFSQQLRLESKIDKLTEELSLTRAEMGAGRGGVSRADNAPAFVVPTERSIHKGRH